jgi:hypothetical protein
VGCIKIHPYRNIIPDGIGWDLVFVARMLGEFEELVHAVVVEK